MGSGKSTHGHEKTFPRDYNDGTPTDRGLTDKSCLLCYLISLGLIAAILVQCIFQSNVKRLTHGYDWKGSICGDSADVKNLKWTYFCGSPERTGQFPTYLLDGSTACVASCPTDTSVMVECLQPAFHNFTQITGGYHNGSAQVEALDMTIIQSVVKQPSYPTDEFGGRFCVPSEKLAPKMRDQIVNGPWGAKYRPLLAFGSIMDAWPLMIGAAVFAAAMSTIYTKCFLGECAGVVFFASMVMASLLTLAAGLFFAWAILVDTNDTTTSYARFNPIMSTHVGTEATLYSVLVGMFLIVIAGVLSILTCTSMTHIDEVIGLVAASNEALDAMPTFSIWWPLYQGISFLALVIVIFIVLLPFVASLGFEQKANIEINGARIPGLQRTWEMHWIMQAELIFYLICVWWVIEIYIQYGHFVVAYVVSCYYFTPGEDKPIEGQNKALKQIGGKHVQVRVGGVDQNYGKRQGTVTDTPNGKVLVVPVGKKGPGLGRNDLELTKFVKDPISMGGWTFVCEGAGAALFHNLGSIAAGAPQIALLRPFRLFAQCVAGFLARSSADPSRGPGFDTNPGTANLKGCFALFSACMDQAFGKYSKHAYTDMVLSGGPSFKECAQNSFDFLVKCGGSLAYLHGAMLMYEFMGCLAITLLTGWIVMICQDKFDYFNDLNSGGYIEDKTMSTVACMVIAFCITFAYMSLWNQTADVLLYCVGWNRKMSHLGHGGHGLEKPGTYCPQALRYLIPAYELEPEYEHGIHAHGVGQMGAIIAAMEHGAMNTSTTKNAPNYSSAFGTFLAPVGKM